MTSLSDRLRSSLRAFTDETALPPPDRSLPRRRERRHLSEADTQDFLDIASHREDPLWNEMELLLTSLSQRYPLRVSRIRRELKWLRKQAMHAKLSWGKK